MRVVTVPVLSDNYSYLLIDDKSGKAAALDPAEADKVYAAAQKEGVTITHVLTTHRHHDHAGGNTAMASLVPGVEVVGGVRDGVPACTRAVDEGDFLELGDDTRVTCISTPCHTKGHICYYVESSEGPPAVFTGDTLFVAGCGRFFEGDASMMHTALNEKLAKLPPQTQVWCGHEYTTNNLKFAQSVDGGNDAVSAKSDWSRARREGGLPTVPSTIGDELAHNPFMRVSDPAIRAAVGGQSDVEVMANLRHMKDTFGVGAGR
eukprot:jgi/Chlat1/6518/Chrsp45S05996